MLPLRWPVKRRLDDLCDNRLRKNLCLEQERIAFGWVAAAIASL